MNLHAGDMVMHWNCGLGRVVGQEERVYAGSKFVYYAVQMKDRIIWVPMNSQLGTRLRFPTPQAGFKQLFAILSSPGNPLPENRFERRMRLLALHMDNRAESLCQIIRDLYVYQKNGPLTENDGVLLQRSRNALLGEWGFVLSISRAQAESELQRLLASTPAEISPARQARAA